jgi:hypothetical protein
MKLFSSVKGGEFIRSLKSPAQGVGRSLRFEPVGFVVRGCVKFTVYRRRQENGERGARREFGEWEEVNE